MLLRGRLGLGCGCRGLGLPNCRALHGGNGGHGGPGDMRPGDAGILWYWYWRWRRHRCARGEWSCGAGGSVLPVTHSGRGSGADGVEEVGGAEGVEEATRRTAGAVVVGEPGVDGLVGPAEAELRRADEPLATAPG